MGLIKCRMILLSDFKRISKGIGEFELQLLGSHQIALQRAAACPFFAYQTSSQYLKWSQADFVEAKICSKWFLCVSSGNLRFWKGSRKLVQGSITSGTKGWLAGTNWRSQRMLWIEPFIRFGAKGFSGNWKVVIARVSFKELGDHHYQHRYGCESETQDVEIPRVYLEEVRKQSIMSIDLSSASWHHKDPQPREKTVPTLRRVRLVHLGHGWRSQSFLEAGLRNRGGEQDIGDLSRPS